MLPMWCKLKLTFYGLFKHLKYVSETSSYYKNTLEKMGLIDGAKIALNFLLSSVKLMNYI